MFKKLFCLIFILIFLISLIGCDSNQKITSQNGIASTNDVPSVSTTTSVLDTQITSSNISSAVSSQSSSSAVSKPPASVSSATSSVTAVITGSVADTGNESLNSLCDSVLAKIITEDMSQRDKAYAVYKWVTTNVRYSGNSDTSSWVSGGITALSTKKGNCYAFYSASRALLTRLGIENTEAVSHGKGHYWNIVKVDGVWRHFDATTGWGTERFLWTGTQINAYKYYNSKLGTTISYMWNSAGCPDTN